MSQIYLIRHGFTPANNANYNGQIGLREIAEDKDMPLEREYGEEQARELGCFLNTINGKTLILVSPYYRACQTLNLALQEMCGDYVIEEWDELRENNTGIHYARTKDEILELYPEASSFYENIQNNPYTTSFLEGESEYDVRDRVQDISKKIKDISDSELYQNIFIFAHGIVNSWIYYWLNGEPFSIRQKNCEVILATGEEKGKSIFLPIAWVPKGYHIKIKEYIKE